MPEHPHRNVPFGRRPRPQLWAPAHTLLGASLAVGAILGHPLGAVGSPGYGVRGRGVACVVTLTKAGSQGHSRDRAQGEPCTRRGSGPPPLLTSPRRTRVGRGSP